MGEMTERERELEKELRVDGERGPSDRLEKENEGLRVQDDVLKVDVLDEYTIQQGMELIYTSNIKPLLDDLESNKYGRSTIKFMNSYSAIVHFAQRKSTNPSEGVDSLMGLYKNTIKDFCRGMRERLSRWTGPGASHALVAACMDEWEKFTALVYEMRKLFSYLDRCKNKTEKSSLFHVAMVLFKTKLYDHLKVNLREALITEINIERDGGKVSPMMIKTVINIFKTMGDPEVSVKRHNTKDNSYLEWINKEKGLYFCDFEEHFLEATTIYYKHLCNQWVGQMTRRMYLERAEQALTDEQARAGAYIDESTDCFASNLASALCTFDRDDSRVHTHDCPNRDSEEE